MALLDIRNFGGIRPAISARALPPDAAQTNDALFPATHEFRPLGADTTITTGLSAAKTLYRVDSSSSWITSTSEISYVRGQINGDTTKRTYYVDNTTPGLLRQFDKDGNDRQVGVPAPGSAVSATTTAGATLTADALAEQGVAAIRAANTFTEPGIRYNGSTILAGPLNNPGLYFATDTSNLPSAVTDLAHYWNLYAKVSVARVAELKLVLPDVDTVYSDESYAYIPITALPYCFVIDESDLTAALSAIVNPRTSAAALSSEQVASFVGDVLKNADPSENAYSLRTDLTSAVRDFYYYLFTYSPTEAVIPDEGTPTDPTGLGPTMPTGPQYEDTGGGLELTAEWQAYYADVAAYNRNKELYNRVLSTAGTDTLSVTDKVRDLQAQARQITRNIEAIQSNRWEQMVATPDWILNKIYGAMASNALPNVDREPVQQARFYLVTFVNDLGEESAPGLPSEQQDTDQYSTTVVSRPSVPSGRNITHWRIYRSATTGDLTTFQYVDEVAVDTTTYTDTVSNEALGEVIPTIDWAEPPSGLQGLVNLPNGVMAAFKGNTLYFCEPYAPYAWPEKYQLTLDQPIVGLGVFSGTLFVGSSGAPSLVSGADSSSMSETKLASDQACVARRSIVSTDGGVFYASPDGLCFASAAGVELVSRGFYDRASWQALVPSSMFSAVHEGVLYMFYDTGSAKGCITFDLVLQKFGTIAALTTVTAVFVDRAADTLFANAGASIVSLFTGSARTATWRTPKLTFAKQAPLVWAKVYGAQSSGAPVTLKWYGDGQLQHTATITNTNPVRLPAGRWLEHEFQIESAARLTRVVIASTTEELQAV